MLAIVAAPSRGAIRNVLSLPQCTHHASNTLVAWCWRSLCAVPVVANCVWFTYDGIRVGDDNADGRVKRLRDHKKLVVGVTGFEPTTPASRTQCSTRLSYTPTCRE